MARQNAATESHDARWEVGGDFSWMPLPRAPLVGLPAPFAAWALGRHCLLALLQVLPRTRKRKLWIPTYFCQEVADAWSKKLRLARYRDDPRWQEPDWRSLRPAPEDLVLAVNYFGARSGQAWYDWREGNRCTLVEDHSHDPLSPAALKSRADYAFSSLRKTLPVPDGGLLWSPRGLPLPEVADAGEAPGVALKVAAMMLKATYLAGSPIPHLKPRYRALLQQAEAQLESFDPSPASGFTRSYLAGGVPLLWRRRRSENVSALLAALEGWKWATPVFRSWPKGAAPLGLALAFPRPALRNRWRKWMEQHNVYCPVHWPLPDSAAPEARGLASRMLTLPADQRYRPEDMYQVARILKSLKP